MCKMYYCDPDKNINCSRSGCYLKGGDCALCSNAEYARTGDVPIEQASIVLKDVELLQSIIIRAEYIS